MLKILSVSLLSLGLATSALAQSGTSRTDDQPKVDSGATHAPQATDDTVTNATRTNCAPNMATTDQGVMPDKTGDASTTSGKAGVNTNGQSANC